MRFDEYNQKTGMLKMRNIKIFDFGKAPIGEMANAVKVLKVIKTVEHSLSLVKFFLRSLGGISGLQFGFHVADAIDKSLSPGDDDFTPLTVVDDDAPAITNIYLKTVAENQYIHLDMSAALTDKGHTSTIEFGLVYNFSSCSSSCSCSSSSSSFSSCSCSSCSCSSCSCSSCSCSSCSCSCSSCSCSSCSCSSCSCSCSSCSSSSSSCCSSSSLSS